jgi:HD superfamily phosphodiesterase
MPIEKHPDQDKLVDSLIAGMKSYFDGNQRLIGHALEVLGYAEAILAGQAAAGEPADPLVVKAAAILHDIGIPQAVRKHGSAAAEFQELEGPPIARAILERFPIDADRIGHICRIIGSHHHPVELTGPELDTPEFRIIWDADRLGNAAGECPSPDRRKIEQYIGTMFRTNAGRALAARKLFKQPFP